MDAYLPILLDALDCGCLLADTRRRIVYLNQAACDLFGVPHPQELLGKTHRAFENLAQNALREPDGFVLRAQEQTKAAEPAPRESFKLKSGNTLEREYRPLFKDGHLAYHLWLFRRPGEPATTETASPLTGVVEVPRRPTLAGSDIGTPGANQERREGESQLRRQALVFDKISDAIILTDAAGLVLDCNHAALTALGLEQKKLLGSSLGILLTADDNPPQLIHTATAKVSQEGCWTGTLIVRDGKNQKHIWQTTAQPLPPSPAGGGPLMWFSRDVTEGRATQDELEERTRELNTLVNLSPDGFVFVDAEQRVSFVNPAFEQMTGLLQQDLIGVDYETLNQSMATLCDAPLPPASDAKDDSLSLTRPKPAILKRRVRTLYDDKQSLCGIVQYYRDITHETEVDRMKSEFLSTAAHELRTPMASVFGFTELLLQHKFAPEKERNFLEIIHRQAGQLVNLVNELLDLARIEARAGKDFKLAEHPLPPIIQSSIAEHLPAGDPRRVTVQLSPRLPRVVVDPDKLQLALSNVLSNAYKYSLGQGSITLSTAQRRSGEAHQVGITVSDQGIGMAPEQVARVFERFYRADTSGKIPGTGLGMSLVKEIMDIFRGSVEIRSSLGQGTSITLWLPAAKPQRSKAGKGKKD